MTKRGMKFDIVQGIDIAEFNYAPYVQQMKDKAIEVVFWTGAYQQSVRLRQAMQQQGYTPKLYMRDPTDYHPDYVESGGAAVDGTVVFTNFTPFEEASKNKETALYLSWLQQVRPGADPTFFGVFAWSAARLFVEKSIALGGGLDRAALIGAVTDDREVDRQRPALPAERRHQAHRRLLALHPAQRRQVVRRWAAPSTSAPA